MSNGKTEKKSIDRYVGPSLYNNKWTNTKWTNGTYYYNAAENAPTKPNYKNKSKKSWQDSAISSGASSNSTSRSNSRKGSRNSSISSNSDQYASPNFDARSLVGVGLIAATNPQSESSGAANPSGRNGKRRGRNKKSAPSQPPVYFQEIYDQNSSSSWPMSQFCNNECCYYFCQQNNHISYCRCGGGENSRRNSGDHSRKSSILPINYYFIMEATYSFNSPIASSNYETGNFAPPPERLWMPVQNFDEHPQSLASITAMSYNILSDKYASPSYYSFCPSWALNWDYRKKLIMHQLRKYQPDIITLQEVETKQYWTFFKPKLEAMGYAGTFSARSRARTMLDEEKQSVDGCALFWRADKFELRRDHVIEFTQLAIAKAEGSEHMLNRVMTRDNIALAAVLQIRPGIEENDQTENGDPVDSAVGTPLVVCSTHIHWDPEYCDVKLVQTMMLVQELTAILDRTASEYDLELDQIPLLLCGDLNSTEDSSVYEFLTTGCIDSDHEDFKDFRGQTCLQKLSSGQSIADTYSHDLILKSAYDIGTMPFTNYSPDFKGVIDYVFASPNLICQNVLGPLDAAWFRDNELVACPCPYVPSDHVPLVAQFSIIPPSTRDQMSISDTQSDLTED